MKSPILAVAALALTVSSIHGAQDKNKLPAEVDAALRTTSTAVLYSLEPWAEPDAPGKRLHRYKILGQTMLEQKQTASAIAEFKTAIGHWNGVLAMCFDPRHGLRVTANGQTYDLLLCYACNQLYVYRGDRLVTSLGVTGSPRVLNDLLAAAKIPLSKSGEKP